MSTAAKTPNYNLSQVAGSDIPDWITDYTSDMKKIDEALKENADDIATVRPDEFSEESTYAAGDYCIKDNVIYKAKTAVEAGAFDISDWTATTIFDELSGLNQNKIKYAILSVTTNGARTQSVQQSDANQIIAATFVRNEDMYYMCVADNIYPSLQIIGTKVIQILYMNKTPEANTRTLQILVAYM